MGATTVRGAAPELCLFDETARRAAPRVLSLTNEPDPQVHLALRWEALNAGERDALSALVPMGGPLSGPHPHERVLRGRLGALELLAPGCPLASLLLAASRAFARPMVPPRLAGVLNVTPDSFSDGGRYLEPDRALERARAMVDEGAGWIDVGGESTRPGAAPVSTDEERRRVVPVVAALSASMDVTISVDTTKALVAEAALEAGATVVNDVSAGRLDEDMLPLVARRGCGFVALHMLGTPRDMQHAPHYVEVVADVCEHLRARIAACLAAGIAPQRLWIDPGIGFGKTLEHNLELLRRLAELRSLGRPLLLGVSRKSFIGRINASAGLGGEAPDTRLGGTAAAVAAAVRAGAEVLRVHDVAVMAEAARVAWALR